MLKHKVYHSNTYELDDSPRGNNNINDNNVNGGYDFNNNNHNNYNNVNNNNVNLRSSTSSSGSYSSYGSTDNNSYYSSSTNNNETSSNDDRPYTPSLSSSSSNNNSPYDHPATITRPTVTGASTDGHVEKKDWNTEFQLLMEQADSESKFKKLSHLARDFVRAAQSYAIIIINELCLPYNEKTIKVNKGKEEKKKKRKEYVHHQ